jgi:Putative peptidoglycan binding domain
MSDGTTPATSERAEPVESPGLPPRRRRRRRLLAWVVVVVVLVGAGAYVERTTPDGISFSHPLGVRHHRARGTQDNSGATSTQPVTRRSLSQTTSVNGTLGYAGSYTVVGQLTGRITALPAVGQVIGQGRVLYRVDGAPVVLLYGSTPAYRRLAEGATPADVIGKDVRQLNRDLAALGYANRADLDPSSDEFGWATKAGIEKLQEHLGVDQTGELDLGRVVFLPTAARVTDVHATLGGPATGTVLSATSIARQVSVNLDAGLQSQVEKGDKVTITLPDNATTPGVVSSVGTVASTPSSSGSGGSASSPPTVTVHIRPTRPADTGRLDQAPVQVAITARTVHNALAVPVTALLGLAGGGYAVEVAGADGTHQLVSVSLGLFDDTAGLVQVTGSGLAAGQHVVVPAS